MLDLAVAIRLRRSDVLRLGEVHRKQFAQSIARGDDAAALDFIETPDDETDDLHGLVYVRVIDTAAGRTYESFLLDDARYPSKSARPDGGLFFDAGTTNFIGIEMSQGGFSGPGGVSSPLCVALQALLGSFPVTVRGPALKTNPPFALAQVPKVAKPPKPKKKDIRPLALEVVSARRYTEAELRHAPLEVRFQCVHAIRPKFAPKAMEDVDGLFALGLTYTSIDPGPDIERAYIPSHRFGFAHVQLAVIGEASRTFDGWLFDERYVRESYWPSTRIQASRASWMHGGSLRSANVEVVDSKIRVQRGTTDLEAFELAAGLEQLGLVFDVQVFSDVTRPGFFGSVHHENYLASARAAGT